MSFRHVVSPFFPVLLLASLPLATLAESGLPAYFMPADMLPLPSSAMESTVAKEHPDQATPALTAATSIDPANTQDLWQRIRNGFAIPDLDDDLVLQQQQWYLSHPESLRRMVDRSKRYLHHIVEELEKRRMPTELALLPMVESAFNPMAYSRAHASGLWQFIPATGKRFDLQQNWWHDQRRDIVASTSAALDYLQTIYNMHGDWHLALASYNWGENAVGRAVQKNLAKGLPTDYCSLTMPNETRLYVPKLMALKRIFSNPAMVAELNLPAIPNRPYFATFETDKAIDVKIAAKLAGMTVEEFTVLNPAHNRPVIHPATPLVIPADRMEDFRANLEQHDAPLSRWKVYTLKSGEKIEKIAPRFGISVQELKRVNGLKGRLRITTGTALLVPAGAGQEAVHLPDNLRPPEILPERTKSKKLAKKGKTGKAVVAAKGKSKAGKLATRGGKVKKPSRLVNKPAPAKITRQTNGRRA